MLNLPRRLECGQTETENKIEVRPEYFCFKSGTRIKKSEIIFL